MPVIKEYVDGLKRHIELHHKKNDDYAEEGKEFYNFEFVTEQMRHFEHADVSIKPFLYLIFTKIARFAQLTKPGKVPNNESLLDTLDDWEIYIGLLRAYIERQQNLKIKLAHEIIDRPVKKYACSICENKEIVRPKEEHIEHMEIIHNIHYDKINNCFV